MRPEDFEAISTIVKKRSGLTLTKDKTYLVESRLSPVARRHGLPTLDDLVRKLKVNPPESLLVEITEAMTTNESFFFRDKTPFDLFSEHILPALVEARSSQKQLRIWCAAASTGQEPYSLAMLLREKAAQLAGFRIEIIGTDLSGEVLDRAKKGLYSQFEVQRGLPIQLLVKYFKKTEDQWQIDPAIRNMVQFKLFNLLDDFRPLGRFDLVFCRNVLIYFDVATKRNVLERMTKQMAPDAHLVLGAAETVVGVSELFKPNETRRGLYGLSQTGVASANTKPAMARAAGA